jgi:hypothetical protein
LTNSADGRDVGRSSIVEDRSTATTSPRRELGGDLAVPHPSSSTHEPGRNGNPATNWRRRRGSRRHPDHGVQRHRRA